jgi:hypothetical protein
MANIAGMSLYRLGASRDVTISGTSAQSTAVATGCNGVRISTDTACRYVVGDDISGGPTAVATSTYLPAGGVEYVKASPGQLVAVIGTAGTLNVTDLTL